MGRPKKIHISPNQPDWVCYDCGRKHGSFKCGTATWHKGKCGVCGDEKSVTEPRDFGYLLTGWEDRRDEETVEGDEE